MHHSRSTSRAGLGALALAAVVATAGCASQAGGSASTGDSGAASEAAATGSASPASSVYGAPVDPATPDPTDVAVDPPVTVAPAAPDGGLPVVLSYAGWNATTAQVEVDGYLPGIVEDDGTCTLTLTDGSTSVVSTVPASADATTTSCGGAAVPGDQLHPGTWTALLTYDSGTSHGTSEATDVTVP